MGSDDYEIGAVLATVTPVASAGDVRLALAGARRLMEDDGWRVSRTIDDGYGERFVASRDAILTTWSIENRVGADGVVAGEFEARLLLEVQAAEPSAARGRTLSGWFMGIAAGFMWGSLGMRLVRRSPRSKALTLVGLSGLALALPATATLTIGTIPYIFSSHTYEFSGTPLWTVFMIPLFRPAVVIGAVVVGLAPVLAVLSLREPRTGHPEPLRTTR